LIINEHQIGLHLLRYVRPLVVVEKINSLLNVEKRSNSPLRDGELRGEFSNMVKLKLSQHLSRYVWHALEIVQAPKALNYLFQVVRVVEHVFRIVIFLQQPQQKGRY
jgi:hypothetical protein